MQITQRLLAATALASVFSTGAAQAQNVELALSTWLGATHPMQVTGIDPWIEAISEASEGRITITTFPAQQLGSAADHYDMARDGIVDISFINPGYQAGRFPLLSLGELPFTFTDARVGSRALHQWYLDYAAAEMPEVHVCLVHLHDVSTLHGTEQILVPEDLRGKNVRPPNATIGRFVNILGGASVQLPASEMRDSIARGVADITASPWSSLFTWGANEVVTDHLDIPLYATVFTFAINRASWDALSDENRAVMEAHCTPEWSERIATPWIDLEAGGRQRLLDDGGHVFHTPNAEQEQMWRDAAAPLLDEWRAAVAAAGHDADAAYAGFVETLESLSASDN